MNSLLRPASRVIAGLVVFAAAGPLPAAESPWVRVAVIQQQPQVDLAVHGRYRISAMPPAEYTAKEGRRLSTVLVRASQEGILLGEQLVLSGGVLVEPAKGATIALNGQKLRGLVEIRRQQDLTLLVINHIDLEDYLRGVLSKEMPHHWPAESLKALAIAARTYALFQRISKASMDYDVTSDVLSQVYGGKSAERRRTSRFVDDTSGLILTYQGQVLPAFYHSTCGGLTEHGSAMGPGPYGILPLHGHIACEFCSGSPFYRWQKRLTYADVAWAVKQQGRGSIWPVDGVEIAGQSPTGRVAHVRIRGARQLLLSGYEFRQLFGFSTLRSTAFTLVPDGDGVILQGRGWGHGVGLCQWGAAELARLGLKAHEILAVYYPGTELATVGQAIRTPGILTEPAQSTLARKCRAMRIARPRLPAAASEEGN